MEIKWGFLKHCGEEAALCGENVTLMLSIVEIYLPILTSYSTAVTFDALEVEKGLRFASPAPPCHLPLPLPAANSSLSPLDRSNSLL